LGERRIQANPKKKKENLRGLSAPGLWEKPRPREKRTSVFSPRHRSSYVAGKKNRKGGTKKKIRLIKATGIALERRLPQVKESRRRRKRK